MTAQLRQLLHTYLSRRSPWGPPWWIYGVAFAAANFIRQAVFIVIADDTPQALRAVSWVATALVVILTVTAVYRVSVERGDVSPPASRVQGSDDDGDSRHAS
jgi:hypothetical protein